MARTDWRSPSRSFHRTSHPCLASALTRSRYGPSRRARAASKRCRVPLASRLAFTTQPNGSMPARRRSSRSRAASSTGGRLGERHQQHLGVVGITQTRQPSPHHIRDVRTGRARHLKMIAFGGIEKQERVARGRGVEHHHALRVVSPKTTLRGRTQRSLRWLPAPLSASRQRRQRWPSERPSRPRNPWAPVRSATCECSTRRVASPRA
jgi:hypothetical protein